MFYDGDRQGAEYWRQDVQNVDRIDRTVCQGKDYAKKEMAHSLYVLRCLTTPLYGICISFSCVSVCFKFTASTFVLEACVCIRVCVYARFSPYVVILHLPSLAREHFKPCPRTVTSATSL